MIFSTCNNVDVSTDRFIVGLAVSGPELLKTRHRRLEFLKSLVLGIFLFFAGSFSLAFADGVLQNGVPASGLAGATGSELRYRIDVPAGASNLVFQLSGGSGDADLYVRYGTAPTTASYDCRPYVGDNSETCAMPSATVGTWHMLIRAYTSYSSTKLGVTYAVAGGGLGLPAPLPLAAVCVTTPRENPVLGALPLPAGGTIGALVYSIPANQNGLKGFAEIIDPATGQFKYTPTGTSWGVDTFGYLVKDAATAIQYSATAVVIIHPRMMPLGDSITAGVITGGTPKAPVRIGYRKSLYDALLAGGYPLDLLGTQNHGYSVANFDSDHEGHAGWSAHEIIYGTDYIPYQDPNCPACGVNDWLNAMKPDVILLHIGTNNFSTDVSDVSVILNMINIWSTGPSGNPVAVFLAQIINRNPYQSVDVLTYNQNLFTLAKNRQSAGVGPPIYLVDQHNALAYPTDLLADPGGLHPDANGYAKMANRWFTAISGSGLLPKCP